MTCFLHVTDTHLSFAQPAPANCGSASQLEAVYAWAAKLDRPPQFILITGDFVHEGGAEDYARARALTARLEETYRLPTLVALGNHDRHAAFYEGYLGEAGRTGRYHYCRQLEGLRLVVLDSAVDDQVPGQLDDAQLDWLEETLAAPCETPTVVALHHPPCGTHILETNQNNLTAPERFLQILARHPVAAVLAGHKHAASVTCQGGIPVCTGAGMAFAIQMPQGGALEFTKDLAAQYCALYDARFYWSVVHPQSGQVIARMTPGQMHSYRAGQ